MVLGAGPAVPLENGIPPSLRFNAVSILTEYYETFGNEDNSGELPFFVPAPGNINANNDEDEDMDEEDPNLFRDEEMVDAEWEADEWEVDEGFQQQQQQQWNAEFYYLHPQEAGTFVANEPFPLVEEEEYTGFHFLPEEQVMDGWGVMHEMTVNTPIVGTLPIDYFFMYPDAPQY